MPVFASTSSSGNAVTIGGKYEVEGSLHNGSFTFVLTADDPSFPMPEGSLNGVKKVSIGPNSSFSFGDIMFKTRGKYNYTVSREVTKSKNMTYDTSTYKVQVSVFNDGTVASVIIKDGSSGKVDQIKYSDKYVNDTSSDDKDTDKVTNKDKEKDQTVTGRTGYKTGDFLPYILFAVLLILIIAAVIVYRKRK